jgi:hypothetical protein
MRYLVAPIVTALLLAGAPCVAAAEQLADGDLGYLSNPCAGVYRALQDRGLNPTAPTYGVNFLYQNAHAVLAPVLAEVATDPSLLADSARLRERIAETTERFYPAVMAERVAAARDQINVALTADPRSPGTDYVAAVMRDSTLGPPWIRVLTAERWALRSLSNC